VISLTLFGLAAISALRSWKTGRMLERQTSIESIRELPWKRFEDLLGEAYRRQGYSVEETLGGGADGGVDLVLRRGGEVTLVQCKRWSAKQRVKVPIVREMYGILADRRAAAAKVVATTTFTSDAIAFAKDKPIELVDANGLLHLLREVQTSGNIVAPPSKSASDHVAPVCPRCSSEMVVREARRGANAGSRFWGCSAYPRCRGTRDI
jgi:restriction system protein